MNVKEDYGQQKEIKKEKKEKEKEEEVGKKRPLEIVFCFWSQGNKFSWNDVASSTPAQG